MEKLKKFLVLLFLISLGGEIFSQDRFSYEIYYPESPWGIYYAHLSDSMQHNTSIRFCIVDMSGTGVEASTVLYLASDTLQYTTDTNGYFEVPFFNSIPLKIDIKTSSPLFGRKSVVIEPSVGSQLQCRGIDTLYIVLGCDDLYRLLIDSPYELNLNQIREIRCDWLKDKCADKKYEKFNIRGLIEI